MTRKSKKIVMPSDEEMARYGEQRPPGEAKPPGEAAEAQGPPVEQQAVPPSTGSGAPEASSEAESWKEKFLRAKADLANYQRRAEKNHAETLRYANAGLLRALLPILDDLQRVLESSADHAPNAQAIIDGVKLTRDNLNKVLRDFHIEPIEALGQPFDPQLHEAMMEQPSADHPDRTVLQEATKGYRLYDRVIRPAKVVVSKESTHANL